MTLTTELLSALEGARIYDLSQPLATGIPCSPNHPGFRMTLMRRHGDAKRPDGSSSANELIVTGGHVGTHIDALAHVSLEGRLHGGVPADEAQRGGSFSALGVESVQPLVCRGVLLDVAAALGAEVLPPAHAITADDLARAAGQHAVEVRAGDVVLVRTGWARHFGSPTEFVGHESGVPGPDLSAARWLVERGVRATGSDTIAYEVVPPGGHRLLPVHTLLLVESGVHIVELLNLEELAADRVFEFGFVLAPLRIVGATGSPVRPLALAGP
jgi:kynurenine formamidase